MAIHGTIKVRRKSVTATKATHTIASSRVNFACVRNDHDTTSIKVNFDNDDIATHYWTLKPGESSPTFGVAKDIKINYEKIGAGSGVKIEIMLWG